MIRRPLRLMLVALLLLGLAGPWAAGAQTKPPPKPKPTQPKPKPAPKPEEMWVVWANDVGWMHLGQVREFKNPGPHSSETWGGLGSEPLKNTQLLGPFPTQDAAMQAAENAVTQLVEGYAALAFPKTYLIATVGGKEYKVGREIKIKRVPLVKFGPLYLIHCTRTHTMYGPQERNDYVMHVAPPKEGKFWTADGSGGVFHNEGTLVGGPFTSNYELCPILKGLNQKGVWIGQRYVSCEDPWWLTVKPPARPAPEPTSAEAPAEETPAEETPTAPPARPRDDAARAAQLRQLSSLNDAIADADHDAKLALAQLGIQRLAAAKIRAKIALLQSALAEGKVSDEMRFRMKERIEELREQLSEIYKEQDETIKKVFDAYDHIADELQKQYQQSPSDDLKKTIEALRKQVEQRRDMANLELYLASGQREKFQALAREYVAQGKYPDVVRLAQAMDFIENKDPRSALYALRKCVAGNPSNRAAQEMLKSLELGYLRAIDDKTLGEAAAVRAACWEQLSAHGEPGFWGYLKDLFTTGITTSVSAIGGKPESLGDLAGTMQDEASVQHAGMLLVLRLREKGLALDEIQGLNTKAFAARIREFFGQEMSDEDALRMRFAVTQAFQNPDVGRLMRQSREQFDLDLGKSYFGTEDFEATWQDWIGDAVNAKNVLLMLGPSAVVSVGGKAAGIGLMTGEELNTAVTVKDAFATLIRLPELADSLGKTKAGQACIQELLKFEESTGFVSKMLAEALLQQGIVEAGKAIGGPVGELAAEVLTALGVGDIDLAVKILRKNGAAPEAIEAIAQRVRKAAAEADGARTPATKYLKQVDDALEEMAGGKPVSDATKRTLRQSGEEVQERLTTVVRKAADDEAGRLVQEEAEKLRALKQTLEDAAGGKRADAEVGAKVVKQLDDKADDAARRLKQQDEVVDKLTTKLKSEEPDLNLTNRRTPRPDQPDMGLTSKAPPQKPKPLQEAVQDSGLESSVPRRAQTPKEIADEAERLKSLDYRKGGVTQQADDAMRRGDYDEAARRYKQALADGQLDPKTAEEVAEKLRVAKETQEAAERLRAGGGQSKSQVTREFTQEEVENLSRTPGERLKPLKTSAGEESLTRPRLVLDADGRPVAVFKPTVPGQRPNQIDVKGEQVAYRLSQRLGGDTPAVAPAKMMIDGQEQSGTLVRFIPDGSDLKVLDAGTQRAVKREVAQDKAMSLFLGDHDRHAGNYFVTKDGEVFNIDHGLSDLAERPDIVNWSAPPDQLEREITRAMDYRAQLPGTGDSIIKGIDNQITYEDLAPSIDKIKNMNESDIRGLLSGVTAPGEETERAVRTLMVRKDNLGSVLERHFPRLSRPSARGLPWLRPTWWAGLWPRWQWQPAGLPA